MERVDLMTNYETGYDPEYNSEEIYAEEQVEESGEYLWENSRFVALQES